MALLTQIRGKRMPPVGNCYLRLEDLRPGPPDLTLGCVTEGGSLAGKLSASSRSSSRSSCLFSSVAGLARFGLSRVSGFLSDLVFTFAVMVRSFQAAGRQGTNAIVNRSIGRCRIVVFGFGQDVHAAVSRSI